MKTPKPSISKKSRYNQGVFVPKNPNKYKGSTPIVYRSAWELTFMNVCDTHPNIVQWASESMKIKYQNPKTGKWHEYIPDFLIMIADGTGKTKVEMIEIKPASQSLTELARSQRDKEALFINEAKWAAARKFCESNGIFFRVMTEHDLYSTKNNRKK